MILFNEERVADFRVEENRESGIFEIAEIIAGDLELVSGKRPSVKVGLEQCSETVVLFATCGKSTILEELSAKGVLDTSKVNGKYEVYGISLLSQDELAATSLAGKCEELLLIYGSDKRGTIYGMFQLSEIIGVSPLVFWGDAKPEKKAEFTVGKDIEMISKEPSVRYRGFFINDEWPCFGNWTFSHYEGFTAKMYKYVFELLLRLKGNYLWPAMWSSSFALDGPDEASAELADLYGVVIGNSHHEPCLRASEEWDIYRGPETIYGNEWNYVSNKEGLLKYWKDGLKRSGKYDSIVTIGMRGERDSEMKGTYSLADNINVLKDVIKNQKKLIEQYGKKDGKMPPMLLAIYKEVEKYYYGDEYTPGLKEWDELDDVILMFCEDNFGHMRYLPKLTDRHPGGYGMYYHLDYHGDPISYEWINSTPLSAIWEQMTIAYEHNVKDVWIVNVGDLKGNEFPLSYFMALAYDFEKWGSSAPNTTKDFTRKWMDSQFGGMLDDTQKAELTDIVTEGILIIGKRRPEAMSSCTYRLGGEAELLKERIDKLSTALDNIHENIKNSDNKDALSAFYSMIFDPLKMGFNLIKMHIYSAQNEHFAKQGKAIANDYAKLVKECIDRDRELIAVAGQREDNKWAGMYDTSHIGFTKWNEDGCKYPVMMYVQPFNRPRMVVSRAGKAAVYVKNYGTPDCLVIDDICWNENGEAVVEIANDGIGSFTFEVEGEKSDWFTWTVTNNEVERQEYLVLKKNEDCARNSGEKCEDGYLLIKGADAEVAIKVHADCLRKSGKVLAKDYKKIDDGIIVLSDFGKEESAIKATPFVPSFGEGNEKNAEYEIEVGQEGNYILTFYFAPSNPIDPDVTLDFTYANISGDHPKKTIKILPANYHAGESHDNIWSEGVIYQQHRVEVVTYLNAGVNTIQVGFKDGVSVLEKIEWEYASLHG